MQAANQKVARLQNSLQVLQSKLQERDHQVDQFHMSQKVPFSRSRMRSVQMLLLVLT